MKAIDHNSVSKKEESTQHDKATRGQSEIFAATWK